MLSKELYNRKVLSLRSGTPIATAISPIINPHNLKIIGLWCNTSSSNDLILLSSEIREIIPDGLVVNDHADLVEPGELIREAQTLKINYQLLGKTVKTQKRKLGKVSDYCFDESFMISKIYVEQSLIKALGSDSLIIGRNQIIEVTDHYILVKEADVKQEVGPKRSAKLIEQPANT